MAASLHEDFAAAASPAAAGGGGRAADHQPSAGTGTYRIIGVGGLRIGTIDVTNRCRTRNRHL
ncbi:hypothetical protein OsJ_29278 [Oryza sativa Japonica Group]|uniref:Uncharacterized protein n=2 Tax=Oryza TaxID=4527 RepID=A3BYL6_ORYSJ|nr:hypothetical protein OsJ_29278 [Oryza sativa Japonica Group]BAD28494.1 hypothetical protein [Oryza sativa Japonica Group]BAD28595.1 hypothetical protein [Oryza sativa Japonica Group]